VGPWPENRKACLEYYEACQTNQQKLIEEENKNATNARYGQQISCFSLLVHAYAITHTVAGQMCTTRKSREYPV
jgi:hypothetical protein